MTTPLPAATSIGRVTLRVRDLDRSLAFYRGILGLEPAGAGGATLGGAGGEPILSLEADPALRPRPQGARGLYHVALLLPDRPSLAAALGRLAAAEHPLQGFSDHLVSEAIYLADPDGNGLELYADRPREAWTGPDGRIRMATRPLDVRGLLATRDAAAGDRMPAATRVGHVHLHVSSLASAEAFYHGTLGFDVVTREYPGALFLAAGGYHHHVGLNTWGRADAPPPDVAGLAEFEVRVPDAAAMASLAERLGAGGRAGAAPSRIRTQDPDGNVLALVA